MAGQRFTRLVVLSRAANGNGRQARWLCRCDCGNERIVLAQNLRNGNTKACGCLNRDNPGPVARHGHAKRDHSGRQSPTYITWFGMIARCTNQEKAAYKWYGARGITVCDQWLSFEQFLADMGERPAGKTLDRYPNNSGNYESGNCRWATRKEQSLNRRTTRMLTHDGKTLCARDWARELGMSQMTFLRRLNSGTWPA